jgi:tRNA (Thr-GGU) A37 N-methylase
MLFYTDNAGFSSLGLTQSRLTDAKTNTIGSFTTTGNQRPNLPGFYFAQVSRSANYASFASGYLEIKFPITSQP